MQNTNYYIYDWMDFDRQLSKPEALWKAYATTSIKAVDGDVLIELPYQKQVLQDDMLADESAPQQSYTLRLRAYGDSIVRVFTSMVGDEMSDESYMLEMDSHLHHMPLFIEEDNGIYTITDAASRVRAVIDTTPIEIDWWSDLQPAPQPEPRITIYPDGNLQKGVTIADDHFSPPRYDALGLGFKSVGPADATAATANMTADAADQLTANEAATISFKCDASECFVGTGERFRKMDLSGQTFYLKNQDGQGVNNRRAYKNIPFYMSSRLYGCFYHTSAYCRLSLADHSSRSVQFRNDRATLDAFIIGGETPERILYHYRQLTGFPPMLPLWSFGIWMSRMTYFSADEVNEICDRLRREQYPCDVIHLDTGWFRTDWLCEWKFNPERFPDPEGFLRRLKDNGFKVSLWQLPYVANGAEQIDEAKANAYISTPIGGWDKAKGTSGASNFSTLDYAGTIDFTSEKATEWYKSLLRTLLNMGVKCIKTDFGEDIHMNATYETMTPQQLNNIYSLLYQKAAYEVTKDVTGDGIVWARAAWAGCQRYPLHWGGDSESSWNGLAGSLKGGLHFGLSGFAFWSHDVPGFHSVPNFMNSPIDPKVYMRWTQFGVFTSHMRYHGSHKREPWHYPTIAEDIKSWWRLRYRLIPYIIEEAQEATHTGLPMIQALMMQHPQDRVAWHIDDEYYFGRKLLVCPVMNSDDRRDIYLPEGKWVNICEHLLEADEETHYLSGDTFEGPCWLHDVEVPLNRMPVFCRLYDSISLYLHDVNSTDDINIEEAKSIHVLPF